MQSTRRDEILHLDPKQDCARIVHLMACYEFPWDMTRSLEIALFRTFCSPNISSLLDKTKEFSARPQQRYDDTDILISELMEWGYDSERGRRSLRRINQQHGRFEIGNEEFLYVLSTFIFEPIRWNQQFGWRLMSETERLGLFHFWREVGQRMGIRDIPEDYALFEVFSREYEAKQFHYVDSNNRVGNAVLGMFCNWFPTPLKPLVRSSILALMDDKVLTAFGFETPSELMRTVVAKGLRGRARVLAYLPKRRFPRLRTEGKHRSYPQGYIIEKLGPPDR